MCHSQMTGRLQRRDKSQPGSPLWRCHKTEMGSAEDGVFSVLPPGRLLNVYPNKDRLVIMDADGTLIDAFTAIATTFAQHGMDLGDLERFQKRRNLFKYLGGLKEFPRNLARQLGKQGRRTLLVTLTEIYRQEARLYPGMAELLGDLLAAGDIRVVMVTRNITHEPEITLARLFARHDLDVARLDQLHYVPLREDKTVYFKAARERFQINPARAYACGDEHKDYAAAQASGMHPFIVSYGFEDFARLTRKYGIPMELIAPSPASLSARVRHALDLPAAKAPSASP